MERESILQAVMNHLFGRKYYAVISNRIGTLDVGLHENIFESRKEAEHLLDFVQSFNQVEVVSFRSHHLYKRREDGTMSIDE